MIWLLPLSPPPSPVIKFVFLSQSSCVSPVELTNEKGGMGDVGGAKSYDLEKAWSSRNHHSKLSDIITGYRYVIVYIVQCTFGTSYRPGHVVGEKLAP